MVRGLYGVFIIIKHAVCFLKVAGPKLSFDSNTELNWFSL